MHYEDFEVPGEDDPDQFIYGTRQPTMFWDFYDPYYYRKSPKLDPRGPREGCCHVSRWIQVVPFLYSDNNAEKRGPICKHDRNQFFVARSRMIEHNVHSVNLWNYIPQWDL